jgi:anhydro-N-acetylmuramic acid kinase
MRAIGLMSGTSLDGIDAALVELRPRDEGYALELVRFATFPFEEELYERLRAALPPATPGPAEIVALDRELGARFALAALAVAAGERVDFAASHGLTLYHRGARAETMQIGSPYPLRDALEASVVFDFRRADCALGGNGAPLVPFVDALLFASPDEDRVALNLGGIANVTVLRRDAPAAAALAWDTGPANMLIDAFVRHRTRGAERFDRDGAYAARGTVDERAVAEAIAREAFYLVVPPPKSTGRERFGRQFLDAHADLFGPLSLEDGCATLTAFTAATICGAIGDYGPAAGRIVVSGGGVHNSALLAALSARLGPAYEIVSSATLGVDPDAKEAIAFAVLGCETLRGRPSNVPSATGAARQVVLGAIAPFELAATLARVREAG